MPVTDCGCANLRDCGGSVGTYQFPTIASRLLCKILGVLSDVIDGIESIAVSAHTEQVVQIYNVLAFGALTNVFALLLDDAHNKLDLKIVNCTNADIEISFDGVTVHERLVPSSGLSLPLGSYGRHEARKVYARYVTAPTDGNVFASARY